MKTSPRKSRAVSSASTGGFESLEMHLSDRFRILSASTKSGRPERIVRKPKK